MGFREHTVVLLGQSRKIGAVVLHDEGNMVCSFGKIHATLTVRRSALIRKLKDSQSFLFVTYRCD